MGAAGATACCVAEDVANKTGEVITGAAAEAYGKVKGAADSFALAKLKAAMEGSRVQEWEGPDVWVDIKEVDLGEGVDAASLLNFSLKGVRVKTGIEIVGTAAQLAGMVTAGGTAKAAEKVSAAEDALTEKVGLPSLGIGSYVAGAAAAAREKLAASASSGVETKASDFDLVVDLEKVFGVEEIKSKVTIVGSSSDAITKYIGDSVLKVYAEDAISKRVTTIITDWQNSTFTADKAKEKAAETAEAASEMAKSKAAQLAVAANDAVKGLKK